MIISKKIGLVLPRIPFLCFDPGRHHFGFVQKLRLEVGQAVDEVHADVPHSQYVANTSEDVAHYTCSRAL